MDKEGYNLFINLFGKFDPDKVWFSPKEVASILDRSDQYVRDAFDSGRLQGMNSNAKGSEKKSYIRIHKSSLLIFMLKESNFDNETFIEGMRLIFENTPKSHLFAVQKLLNEKIKALR